MTMGQPVAPAVGIDNGVQMSVGGAMPQMMMPQMMMYPNMQMAPVDPRFAKLQAFCAKHEMDTTTFECLKQLVNYEIVIVADDSGSMATSLKEHRDVTRWDELKDTIYALIDLATCVDTNGTDLYFLNRGVCKNVTDVDAVNHAFKHGPKGSTPLGAVFKKVISEKYSNEKKLLILIATDGVPNEGEDEFYKLVETRCGGKIPKEVLQDRIRIGFMACSDVKSEVKYLNKMDKKIPGVDTTDDFNAEKKQTKNPNFNKAMYIAKAILGPVDSRFDQVDRK